MALLMKDKHWL